MGRAGEQGAGETRLIRRHFPARHAGASGMAVTATRQGSAVARPGSAAISAQIAAPGPESAPPRRCSPTRGLRQTP